MIFYFLEIFLEFFWELKKKIYWLIFWMEIEGKNKYNINSKNFDYSKDDL